MHDVVIAGGGPVGSALALALSQAGLSALLLEARVEPADDRRSLALSFGSRLILDRLGVWQSMDEATSIESIHVSQRGGPGRALLTAREAGLAALGYVVSYTRLQRTLAQAAAGARGVEVVHGARAEAVDSDDQSAGVRCTFDGTQRQAQGRLVAIADGGALAQTLAPRRSCDYGQSALVASVRTDRPHGNRAYERFTAEGPIALLPFGEGYSLVWTCAPSEADRRLGLDPALFLAELQQRFGDRAGHFSEAEGRMVFPLALRVAGSAFAARTLLLGNAAQTLHPVAGQGFNLGLRDAWELAQAAAATPSELGNTQFIQRYVASRKPDRATSVLLTDSLVRLFSNHLGGLALLRGCGLTLLDALTPAKRLFMSRMSFGA
jgi:2-octaprenyl-6-methoxyphenol hydroxylase